MAQVNPRQKALHKVYEQIREIQGNAFLELSEKQRLLAPLEAERDRLIEPPYHLLVVSSDAEHGRKAYNAKGVQVHETTGVPIGTSEDAPKRRKRTPVEA